MQTASDSGGEQTVSTNEPVVAGKHDAIAGGSTIHTDRFEARVIPQIKPPEVILTVTSVLVGFE